jgi:cyclohexyl-isocyanide hydratase
MNQIRGSKQLQIGALIFPGVDQIDFTGPFEIFSRLPGATYHIIAKDKKPIRDTRGLILTPEKTYSEISRLDLLHVPGGPGQEALMDDEETLSFIREQAANADYIFSVCTGALILGAAPKEVVQTVRAAYQSLTDARLVTARRIRAKLGIEYNTVTAAD